MSPFWMQIQKKLSLQKLNYLEEEVLNLAEATRLATESAAIALRMSNEAANYAKQARNKG